jgi:hypothetical protein
MRWFILAFSSIYLLMNLYVYMKLRHRAILLGPCSGLFLSLFDEVCGR